MNPMPFLRQVAGILCLGILALDGMSALVGMRAGIEICLQTLIPSLFPFIILCSLITGNTSGNSNRVLRIAGRFCKMPSGSEFLLLAGFLGGYPVGARSVSALYQHGLITRNDARRMAVFCNNAGPAFLFGILGSLFPDKKTVLLLWSVQILGSLLMGHFLPADNTKITSGLTGQSVTMAEALRSSISAMSAICGWVILFRVVLEYLRKWIFIYLPQPLVVLLTGVLELSNGCISLSGIGSEFLRFLLASAMLSFGGICICLQTASVCPKEILSGYWGRKLLQCGICTCLSVIVYAANGIIPTPYILLFLLSVPFIIGFLDANPGNHKKEVAF